MNVTPGAAVAAADLERFAALVLSEDCPLLGPGPVHVARAPGRLDVMGGVADYCGSLVLELPLAVATVAAVQRTSAGVVELASRRGGRWRTASLPPQVALDVDALRRLDGDDRWVAYVAGTLAVLADDGLRLDAGDGVRIVVDSTVPEGAGVSSSAAVEVAVMAAVADAFGVALDGVTLALRCQQVEHRAAGAPCGVMDQMTAALGEGDSLLRLRCRPADVLPPVAVPADLAVWGVDSGERHSVGGAAYRRARVGAAIGYRVIAEAAGLPVRAVAPGRVAVDDHRWGGWLAAVGPVAWATLAAGVPEQLDGDAVLDRLHGIADAVVDVDPAATYDVRVATAHPILEDHRVRTFAALLESGGPVDDDRGALLGELMAQSHAGYSAIGLGSPATDRLLELVAEAGPGSGLFGGRVTGGGSGGTVAVLGRPDARPALDAVVERYRAERGAGGTVFAGSSDGAVAAGTRTLVRR